MCTSFNLLNLHTINSKYFLDRPQLNFKCSKDTSYAAMSGRGLLGGDGFHQGKAPDEFLGVEDQRVVLVAGCDGEANDFRRSYGMAPCHVDLRNEDPPLCWVVDLLETDGPDDAADIEDGGDADLTG